MTTGIEDAYVSLIDELFEDEPMWGGFVTAMLRPITHEEVATVIARHPDVLDEVHSQNIPWADYYRARQSDPIYAADQFMAGMDRLIVKAVRKQLVSDLNSEVDNRAEAAYERSQEEPCYRGNEYEAAIRDQQIAAMRLK